MLQLPLSPLPLYYWHYWPSKRGQDPARHTGPARPPPGDTGAVGCTSLLLFARRMKLDIKHRTPAPITDSFNDTELLNFGTMQNRPLMNGIFYLRPDYSHPQCIFLFQMKRPLQFYDSSSNIRIIWSKFCLWRKRNLRPRAREAREVWAEANNLANVEGDAFLWRIIFRKI